MNPHAEAFRDEAQELLVELESALLELEQQPDDAEQISRVFRSMHTIKGSGAMFGFDEIADFTHHIESVYDLVRAGKITVNKGLIDITLAACDQIKQMIQGNAADAAIKQSLMQGFRDLLTTEAIPTPARQQHAGPSEQNDVAPMASYRIRFKPDHDLFQNGANPLLLLDEIRELGACAVIAQTGDIPELAQLEPESCYLYWDVILSATAGIDAIRDIFIFVEDNCELNIDVIEQSEPLENAEVKRIGEILIERGDLDTQTLKDALDRQQRLGEVLVNTGVVQPGSLQAALAEQRQIIKIRQQQQDAMAASSIRVAADKLDKLVDLVGELVTTQARLSQKANDVDDTSLTTIAEEVERLTSELRDNTMSIRMLPIGTTFSKFKRMVRDMSAELGKQVALTTEGGETELDKTVIERLNDPLVHIIRNSIDHGIELPAVREQAGKSAQGAVHLRAEHSGAYVLVSIADDGAGLDPAALRQKAMEKGLISSEADLTENELFNLIFTPGFSTAQTVTDISGRGVGMDVVKRSVEALRGSIDIAVKQGQGTTITFKLPLTLAIIDGLLVSIGNGFFILPLASVEECMELNQKELDNHHGRQILNLRGEMLSYISLRQLFAVNGSPPPIQQVVIVEIDGYRVGLVVDNVIGSHQTVIKSLGRVYRGAREFSGATILADGTVALILDIAGINETAEKQEGI